MKKTNHLPKMAGRAILTLVVVSCLSGRAWARDDWHKHARDARDWHHQHVHNGRVVYENDEPYAAFSPPVVVEPPPPAPGLNIIVPLNIH